MTDTLGAGFSCLVSFVSAFADAFAFFAASASLALLAFFSLMNWTRGVVVTLLCFKSESSPLPVGFATGSVRLWRKSMNSGS